MNKFLDSSAWIEFLDGSEQGAIVCGVVEHKEAVTSTLCLAEVGAKLHKKGRRVKKYLEFIQREARIITISEETAMRAGPFANEQRKKRKAFGIIDALIYLSAQEKGITLLTKDNDFRGLPGVEMLS